MDNGNSTKENGDVRGSHVLVPSAITWGQVATCFG